MSEKNFSFLKLREEIITKSGGISHAGFKEPQKKLKFEPNLNITRQHIPEHVESIVPAEVINVPQEASTKVDLSESKFLI